ncbi:MAG: hypothetical protein AB1Z38_14775 [Desulfotignum sp.]
MTFDPEITFHVPGDPGPVLPGCRLWQMPLSGKNRCDEPSPEWTVGDYLEAARAFLLRDQGRVVCQAASRLAGHCRPIQTMAVCLEKHGAFYHPLKITLDAGSDYVTLVLNGAVRDPGFTLIETEFRLLERLVGQVVPGFIPRVFGAGTLVTEKGGVGFFLGQWFDKFHEFHVTRTARGDRVAIWKDDGTHGPIPWHDAVRIYENIAYVLTAYYEVDTGHEIFPWHHAAGDFVTNFQGDVRLITVRGMDLLTEIPSDISEGEVRQLFCLLFYFLNLTLCMRLDRLDGTGPIVWLPDVVLDATVKGMHRSLADREILRPHIQPVNGFSARFPAFAKSFGSDQLHQMMDHLLEDRHFSAEEAQLIRNHLDSHCRRICRILAQL